MYLRLRGHRHGDEIAIRPPRSSIVSNSVFRIVPYPRERRGLSIHQVTPILLLAPPAKVTDEVEHFPGQRLRQASHLFIDQLASPIPPSAEGLWKICRRQPYASRGRAYAFERAVPDRSSCDRPGRAMRPSSSGRRSRNTSTCKSEQNARFCAQIAAQIAIQNARENRGVPAAVGLPA